MNWLARLAALFSEAAPVTPVRAYPRRPAIATAARAMRGAVRGPTRCSKRG